ncbi:unnamed protein product [Symbiodinium sp. CCMP2456]|nr:unnamed protein product [Symbiodinium sp. CCMP2456]
MAQRSSPLGLAGRPLAGSALRCALWAPVPRCRSCRAASTGPPVKEGEVLEMRMETLTSSGQALGRIGPTRWVVMIFGALPRELVQLRIVRNYRSRSEARLCRILEASPERAAPRCPLFTQCSGCQYQPCRELLALLHMWLPQCHRRCSTTTARNSPRMSRSLHQGASEGRGVARTI